MIDNPFTSTFFLRLWGKHFNQSASGTRVTFVKDLLFAKHRFLPFYFNYGKTHTKGISYTFDYSNAKSISGKVLLIYDVPTFFDTPVINHDRIKLQKVKQYPGFLINLKPYRDLDAYMASTFSKSSRYKLKKYKKKLETCFDINYKMFHGEMSKEEYGNVFESFRNLLVKRFDDKQIINNNLEKQEWDFYQEAAYPMILDKKAGLFVIYDDIRPIGVTLCYFSENTLFDAITVFDIDYAKFHLGSVTIMKLIEWSILNNLEIFDFSKGYFDYKKRWATKEYNFEYHVLHDSKSVTATFMAVSITYFFKLKQFLRDKHINDKLHKLVFMLRKNNATKSPNHIYEFFEITKEYRKEELMEIDWKKGDYAFLNIPIFDFLYLNNENMNNVQVFRIMRRDSHYLLKSETKSLEMKVETT